MPMYLRDRLARDFSHTVRNRGEQYYRHGAVEIEKASASEVEASVQGSKLYPVGLQWDHGVLSAWCDCPYFWDHGPCKHLWATILACEAKGLLSTAAEASKLKVKYESDLVADGSLDRYGRPTSKPTYNKVPTAAPPKPAPPTWRQQLAQASPHSDTGEIEVWPASREILYLVDTPANATSPIVVWLQWRERKGNGDWKAPKELRLQLAQIAQLPPTDREVLTLLSGSAPYYNWDSRNPYQQLPSTIQVSHPLASLVVPAMARSGHLYLWPNKDYNEMRPLIWDAGDAWQFRLEIHPSKQGGWSLVGALHRGDEGMELAGTMARSGLIFTRDSVARLAEDTESDWLSRMRSSGPIEVPKGDADDLLASAAQLSQSAAIAGSRRVTLPGSCRARAASPAHPSPQLRSQPRMAARPIVL